ncbi:virulence factor SrfB [Komagataeibacter sp. FNDCR2]|nr:virulence factor SrfB [Komagataeibacter sp. FNDCR2]MCE2574124.1 virulence factor SrfB [Komagataeibacter sp. FNDCR2]
MPEIIKLNETISLVPGSLIQFHTIPLDAGKFKSALSECNFWVCPDQEESTEERKVTKLIPLERAEIDRREFWVWHEPAKGKPGQNERKTAPCRGGIPSGQIITVSHKEILETLPDQWIPLPWLAHWENDGRTEFHNYPSNWVRGCLRVNDSNTDYCLELAFDTDIDLTESSGASRSEEGRMMPTLTDVRDDVAFGMPDDPGTLRNWLTENFWVREWMGELTRIAHSRRKQNAYQPDLTDEEQEKKKFEPDVIWLAFAQALSRVISLPKVRFIKLDRSPPIEVDLVLDLGNFRSCGVMIEQMPDNATIGSNGLENCSLLELRDLARPSCNYKGIFPSRVEFGKASFGLDHRSRGSGRSAAFYWPGQVRVGQQAERMLTSKRGTEGGSGLATPKRYLWSREPWMNGWYFNTTDDCNTPPDEQPVTGRFRKPLREILTEPDTLAESWDIDDLPHVLSYDHDDFEEKGAKSAGQCILSRSQLFVLMVEELVLHAIRFMNDPNQRAKRGLEGTARHLRSVVLTVPPGMALAERRILLERIKTGICFAWQQAGQNRLWKEAGWKKNAPASIHDLCSSPKVECDLDEATATQLVWLENEIVSRLGGNVKEFFQLYGYPRETTDTQTSRTTKKDTIRIASLDIGGGTTDMMVATYAREESDALTPTQNFRESFQLAGDNLLEKVTADIVLKQAIAPALARAGVPEPDILLRTLFRTSCEDVRDEAVRHLLVSILLEPAGLKVLELYEDIAPYETGIIGHFTLRQTESLPVSATYDMQWTRCADFLRKILRKHYADFSAMPATGMENFLNPPSIPTGNDTEKQPEAFDLRDITVTVDTLEVEKCIQSTLGETLKQFSAAIRAYGCDVMLLSGRPSKLRHVSDIITGQFPVMPQRIIRMHDYTISPSYPFSDARQKISDPKTTVVSGAAIWKLAGQKRLLNFTLRTEELKMKSTVNYIGVMQARAGTVAEALNNEPLDLETPFPPTADGERKAVIELPNFENEVHLGWRQLPTPSWTATPLYRIRFRENGLETLKRRGLFPPYVLTVEQETTRQVADDLAARNPLDALERRKADNLRQEDLVLRKLRSSTGEEYQGDLRDILEIQLMTTLEPKGHWRDTGCLALD